MRDLAKRKCFNNFCILVFNDAFIRTYDHCPPPRDSSSHESVSSVCVLRMCPLCAKVLSFFTAERRRFGNAPQGLRLRNRQKRLPLQSAPLKPLFLCAILRLQRRAAVCFRSHRHSPLPACPRFCFRREVSLCLTDILCFPLKCHVTMYVIPICPVKGFSGSSFFSLPASLVRPSTSSGPRRSLIYIL